MFGLLTKKRFKIAMERIYKDIKNIFVEIKDLKVSAVSKEDVTAMIKEALLKHSPQVQEGAEIKDRPVQVALPMRLKKGYKKKQILEEMRNLTNQGYAVTEIEEAIINRFGISRRTFYNYKKKLVVKVQV